MKQGKTIEEMETLLNQYKEQVSYNTWFAASQFFKYNKTKLVDIYLEGSDILFEGLGKGIITIKHRD